MSIEIRRTADGTDLECDWGIFDNSDADPRRGPGHLVLILGDCIERMLQFGPEPATRGLGTVSCSRDGDRLFAHLEIEPAGRWTWELFKAHWWDNGDPRDIFIGRWPD